MKRTIVPKGHDKKIVQTMTNIFAQSQKATTTGQTDRPTPQAEVTPPTDLPTVPPEKIEKIHDPDPDASTEVAATVIASATPTAHNTNCDAPPAASTTMPPEMTSATSVVVASAFEAPVPRIEIPNAVNSTIHQDVRDEDALPAMREVAPPYEAPPPATSPMHQDVPDDEHTLPATEMVESPAPPTELPAAATSPSDAMDATQTYEAAAAKPTVQHDSDKQNDTATVPQEKKTESLQSDMATTVTLTTQQPPQTEMSTEPAHEAPSAVTATPPAALPTIPPTTVASTPTTPPHTEMPAKTTPAPSTATATPPAALPTIPPTPVEPPPTTPPQTAMSARTTPTAQPENAPTPADGIGADTQRTSFITGQTTQEIPGVQNLRSVDDAVKVAEKHNAFEKFCEHEIDVNLAPEEWQFGMDDSLIDMRSFNKWLIENGEDPITYQWEGHGEGIGFTSMLTNPEELDRLLTIAKQHDKFDSYMGMMNANGEDFSFGTPAGSIAIHISLFNEWLLQQACSPILPTADHSSVDIESHFLNPEPGPLNPKLDDDTDDEQRQDDPEYHRYPPPPTNDHPRLQSILKSSAKEGIKL